MANIIKKQYYPLSDLIGVDGDLTTNTLSLFDPQNPTINKSSIVLLKERFFKSDWVKNLKDDFKFTGIKANLVDIDNDFVYKRNIDIVNRDLKLVNSTCEYTTECKEQDAREKLKNEVERRLFSFINIEIRKQDDLYYKNDLASLNKDDKIDFYLRGIDDLEVTLTIDSIYKNYISLNNIKSVEDAITSGACGEEPLFLTEQNRIEFNEKFKYLLQVKFLGNLATVKGQLKR